MNPTFITTLAWIFGFLSTLVVVLRIWGYLSYTETDQYFDMLKGVRKEFPLMIPIIIAIICWVWIFTV